MELQLGLALPINPIKNFDLNKYENDSKDSCCSVSNKAQKRSFDDYAFKRVSPVVQTLPLLSWNDKPNDEDDGDDDRKNLHKGSSCLINESNREEDGIVGWPPIKLSRRNFQLYQQHYRRHHQGQQQQQPQQQQQEQQENQAVQGSIYVKVKMEGVPIGRKVNLGLHNSYQTLTKTLICMFAKYEGNMRRSNEGLRYTLAYQQKNGDWLLVGDTTPWQYVSFTTINAPFRKSSLEFKTCDESIHASTVLKMVLVNFMGLWEYKFSHPEIFPRFHAHEFLLAWATEGVPILERNGAARNFDLQLLGSFSFGKNYIDFLVAGPLSCQCSV